MFDSYRVMSNSGRSDFGTEASTLTASKQPLNYINRRKREKKE